MSRNKGTDLIVADHCFTTHKCTAKKWTYKIQKFQLLLFKPQIFFFLFMYLMQKRALSRKKIGVFDAGGKE